MVIFHPLLPQFIYSFPLSDLYSCDSAAISSKQWKTLPHCFTCLDGYKSCAPCLHFHTHTHTHKYFWSLNFSTPSRSTVGSHGVLRKILSPFHTSACPPPTLWHPVCWRGELRPLAILDYPPYKSLNPGHHHRATVCIHINTRTQTVSYKHTKCNHNADLRRSGRASDSQLSNNHKI